MINPSNISTTKKSFPVLVSSIIGLIVGIIFITIGVKILMFIYPMAKALSNENPTLSDLAIVIAGGFAPIVIGIQCIATVILVYRKKVKRNTQNRVATS